ncbi:hypothetical protein MNBD_ALPHA03-1268 [hydrothermal vent metagenome]|uniref:Uncharacterized protein n=1 Tax=hydrothermal vent metagenome TaxID=652676 RepID=A0A3B1B7R0_9ZZZZ
MSEQTEIQEPAFEESVEQPPEEKSEDNKEEIKEEGKDESKEENRSEAKEDEQPRASRRKRRTQQYINNLKHEAETNKEQAAYWRGKAEALETKTPEPTRPQREDYISEDDYLTDVLDYRDQVKASKEPEKPEEPKPSEQPKAPDVERQSKLYEAGLKTYGEDFTEAMQDTSLAISPLMGEYVLDSDVGAEVYMLLADNPEKAIEIFNMKSVAQQVRALDAIESGIKSSNQGDEGVNSPDEGQAETKTPPKEIPQRKVTQAPPPVSHEKGESAPDMDESKMSDSEWFKKEQSRAAN